MKAHSLFYLILLIGITMSSCTNTRPLLDDDVYVMKTAAVPIGEDLLDETAYSTYKYRLNEEMPTNGYYNASNSSALNLPSGINSSSWFMYSNYDNFGTLSGGFNPYWGAHRNGYYMYDGYYNMWGQNMYYGNGYFPYYGNFNCAYSPFGCGYGPYGNFYGNGYGFNGYGYTGIGFTGIGYDGFGYNGYGYNGYGYGHNGMNNSQPAYGGSAQTGNYVSGPRATSGGYYSGSNRGGSAQLKTQSKPVTTSVRPVVNSRSVTNSRTTTPAANSREATSRPQYTRNGGVVTRTAEQRTNGTARPSTQSRTTNSGSNSGNTRTNSGTTRSTPSTPRTITTPASTPRSTGTSGGNSGGRSGGSSGGSSGSGRSGGRGGN